MVQQPLVGQGLLIIKTSRSHSDTPHSVGLLCTSDQPDAETSTYNVQPSWQTDIQVPGGIRTRNRRKQAAADPRDRPRGYWDRPLARTYTDNYYKIIQFLRLYE
jgi:hypothetical protein